MSWIFTYLYDSEGKLLTHIDPSNRTTSNVFDLDGRLKTSTQPNGSVFTFDVAGKATAEQYTDGRTNTISYNSDGAISGITNAGGYNVQIGYDNQSNANAYAETFGNNTKSTSYTYDDDGNILTVSEGGIQKVRYVYNLSGELSREDNVWQNLSIVYAYDDNGNMTGKTTYAYTTGDDLGTPIDIVTNQYNSQNQLTSFDGQAITYDTSGNMSTYNGWTYNWQNTTLSGMANANNTISYQYNDNGIRTSKTVNNVTTNYELDGNNNIIGETNGTDTIHYIYDSKGSPVYMTLNGTAYYYEHNLQGDIVGIVDSSNNEVVSYSYDSWGKLLSITGTLASTVGEANHLRYRGYYYDTETSLYYLQSRYYNPEIGRFISKDDPYFTDGSNTIGTNLWVYCGNNPVSLSDPTGYCYGYANVPKYTHSKVWTNVRYNGKKGYFNKWYTYSSGYMNYTVNDWGWNYNWFQEIWGTSASWYCDKAAEHYASYIASQSFNSNNICSVLLINIQYGVNVSGYDAGHNAIIFINSDNKGFLFSFTPAYNSNGDKNLDWIGGGINYKVLSKQNVDTFRDSGAIFSLDRKTGDKIESGVIDHDFYSRYLTIPVKTSDGLRMYNKAFEYISNVPRYNTFYGNCSTRVSEILSMGSNILAWQIHMVYHYIPNTFYDNMDMFYNNTIIK